MNQKSVSAKLAVTFVIYTALMYLWFCLRALGPFYKMFVLLGRQKQSLVTNFLQIAGYLIYKNTFFSFLLLTIIFWICNFFTFGRNKKVFTYKSAFYISLVIILLVFGISRIIWFLAYWQPISSLIIKIR